MRCGWKTGQQKSQELSQEPEMGVLVSSRFVITVFQFERQGEASMVIPDILRSKIAYFLTFIYLNGM